MGHRGGASGARIEQQAQVVVRVREVGLGGERLMVGRDRIGGAAGLLQQAGQVEVGDRIARSVVDGGPVVVLRLRRVAAGMVQAPQVDVRVGQSRIERQ